MPDGNIGAMVNRNIPPSWTPSHSAIARARSRNGEFVAQIGGLEVYTASGLSPNEVYIRSIQGGEAIKAVYDSTNRTMAIEGKTTENHYLLSAGIQGYLAIVRERQKMEQASQISEPQ